MTEMSIRDTKMLVAGIKDSYQRAKDAWTSAIEQSIACGGKLAYVKSQLEHGRWLPFLAACEIPQRTASGMMRMHEHRVLLREKSAETWVDAMRIVQSEANPNRQRIADLSEQRVETIDAVCIAHSMEQPASEPIESVIPRSETEQPASEPEPQSEVPTAPESPEPSDDPLKVAAQIIREALHKRISPCLPPDEQARMEAIESAVDLIGSLNPDWEVDLFAELVTRRVNHCKVSSMVRILSVAVTIPDLIDLLFDEFDFEDCNEKDGYVDTALEKALTLKIGKEKTARVLAGETALMWSKTEPVPA